jgi:hypothetical protein
MPDDHPDLSFSVEIRRGLRVHAKGQAQEGAQGENHRCDRRSARFHSIRLRDRAKALLNQDPMPPSAADDLFRRTLVDQSRGCLIVPFLARQQRL